MNAEELTQTSVVVNPTSTGMNPFRSIVAGDVNSAELTLPIEQSFYQHDAHTYAILTSQEVEANYQKDIRITSDGIINRISLDDFPIGQYTLSVNGHNCSTAQYDPLSHCFAFDWAEHQSLFMKGMIDTFNH